MKHLSNNNIQFIYHLADIHIRPLDRHIEYKNVFKKLYIYLSNQSNLEHSLIIICGDLVHEKDKITPELIILLRDFLKELSLIMSVIIFSGNHDLIENNTDRMANLDALTRDLENINYLKYTDVYEYGNILFSLNSLEDKKDFRLLPKTDKIIIGLYHGMLQEISFSKGGISVDDFENYDFVLLGDVHERQFLKENIAYSGSLIQQNFGESIENHGLIKWDILNRKSEPIDIQNDVGYITIENSNITDLPKYSHIRLKITPDIDSEQLLKLINEKTNVLSEKVIKFKSEDDKIKYEEEFVQDINDEDIIKEQVDDKIYSDIIKLHNELKLENNFNKEHISEYKWSIQNIEFKNLFIYGNDVLNTISFSDKSGVIGILGKNAIGKSTIINIIIFALFDKISSEYNSVNIINKNSKNMYVKVEFTIGNTLYIIEKNGTIQKNNVKTRFNTIYKKIENAKEINLNGKDRIRTQELIEQTIGIRDIFMLCNVVSNTNTISILNMTNMNVIDILSKLLNLDKYELLFKKVSEKLKIIQKQLTKEDGIYSILKNCSKEDYDKLLNNLVLKKTKLKEYSVELNELQEEHNIKKTELDKISKLIINVNIPKFSLEELQSKEQQLNTELNDYKDFKVDESIDVLYKQYFNSDVSLKDISEQFKTLDKIDKIYNKNELQELELQLRVKISELKKYNENIKLYTSSKSTLNLTYEELIEKKKNCKLKYINKYKIIEDINITHKNKLEVIIKNCEDILFYNCNKISEDCNKFKLILNKRSFYSKESNSYNTIQTNEILDELCKFFNKIKTTSELNNIRSQLEKNKKEYKKIMDTIKKNEEAKLFNKEIDDSKLHNEKITNELKLIENTISDIKYNELSTNILNITSEITGLKELINVMKESIKYHELKDLLSKLKNNEIINKKIRYLKLIQEKKENDTQIIEYHNYNKIKDINKQNESIQFGLNNKLCIINNSIIKTSELISRLKTEIDYDSKLIDTKKIELDKKNNSELIIVKLKKEIYLLETYKNLVNKKCIPTIMLKKKINFIEKDINIKLEGLVKFKIKLFIDDNFKFNLDIHKHKNILKAYMCSGYERFILDIMIKNSLNKYCYNNKSNIFCIDEGLDCIDDDNLKKFKIVLERLQRMYNHIILISQIDRIHKYIDHEIFIEYKNNSSLIKN